MEKSFTEEVVTVS